MPVEKHVKRSYLFSFCMRTQTLRTQWFATRRWPKWAIIFLCLCVFANNANLFADPKISKKNNQVLNIVEISDWVLSEKTCTDVKGITRHCDQQALIDQAANLPDISMPKTALSETEELVQLQSSVVDIFFFGRLISTSRVHYDSQILKFDSPELILDALTGVRQLDQIAQHLSQELPLNTTKSCSLWREKEGCGWLKPDVLGVIFNKIQQRVDLFVADNFLSYKARFRNKYLPPAIPRKTVIVSGDVVATKLAEQEASHYATATGIFSYGQGNLSINGNYNSDSGQQRIRTASLTHYFADHELQAGTFIYAPAGYLANLDVMGLRWNSSLKSRRNAGSLIGNHLEVFLPRRSIVQLAIGERVYSGKSYAAGNHSLDTSKLPEGTYELEIRINDPIEGDRIERRLFTRSILLPPSGQGNYMVMLGMPVDQAKTEKYPQREEHAVFAADYGRRLNSRTAWHLGFMQLRDDSLLQAQLVQLNRRVMWKARVLVGESNTYGVGFTTSYNNAGLKSSINVDSYSSGLDFDPQESAALQKLLSSRFTQTGLDISKKFIQTLVGFKSNYRYQRNNGSSKRSNQFVAFVRHPVFENIGMKGYLEARYQKDDIQEAIFFQLKVDLKRQRWLTQSTGNLGYDEEGESKYNASVKATHLSASATAESFWKNSVFASTSDETDVLGVKTGFVNRHFHATASTEHIEKRDSDDQIRSVGELGVQIGLGSSGFALGGMGFTGAGVIVDVTGQSEDRAFDIFVNGKQARSGLVGSRHFVSLKPFKDYSLKLSPTSLADSGFDRQEYKFTLYPGNVEHIHTFTVPRYQLITTLVDADGHQINEAQIYQHSGVSEVGEDGILQLTVSSGELLIVGTDERTRCMVVTPDAGEQKVVLTAKPLVCFIDPIL